MTMAVSVAARNALLDDIDTSLHGRSLRILTGSPPSDPDSQTGTVLATITLPTPAFGAASGGTMTYAGIWQDLSIDTTGTAGYFRLVGANSPFYNVHGTITATGGGGDMEVDTTSFVAGQSFAITAFTLTCS